MTRKKFVKQLMGMGVQRNRANEIAAHARRCGMTYEEALVHERIVIFGQDILDGIATAMESMRPTIERIGNAFRMLAIAAAESLEHLRTIWPMHMFDYDDLFTPLWPKENPHLDGLRADVVLVDELDGLPSDKLHEQAVQACAGGGEQ